MLAPAHVEMNSAGLASLVPPLTIFGQRYVSVPTGDGILRDIAPITGAQGWERAAHRVAGEDRRVRPGVRGWVPRDRERFLMVGTGDEQGCSRQSWEDKRGRSDGGKRGCARARLRCGGARARRSRLLDMDVPGDAQLSRGKG